MNTAVALFKGVLEISLFASVMIAIVLTIRAIAKDKINIRIVSFLWFLVILRLCVPGMLESPVHIDRLLAGTEEAAAQPVSPDVQNNGYTHIPDNTSANTNTAPVLGDTGTDASDADAPKTISFWERIKSLIDSIDIWLIAALLWIAGGAIVLLSAIRENTAFCLHIRKHDYPVEDQAILEIIVAHRRTNRIRRGVRISACPSVHMPMVVGVFRPRILLPTYMIGKMKPAHMDAILLHEICHIRRRDILKGYACILVKALHWFNPLVWLCVRKIKEDIEFGCDQRVLRLISRDQGVRYCESLVYATRCMNQVKAPQFATLLCESRSHLKGRILKMIRPQKQSKAVAVVSVMMALVMAVGCFTTACQPTPDKEIVQGKNSDTLEQKINEGQDAPAPASRDNTGERADMIVTDTWQDDTFEEKPYLSVKADAQILMPDVDQYIAYEIDPAAGLTNDMVRELIGALVGDAELHDGEEVSKAEVEARVVDAKRELHDMENDVYKDTFSSEEGEDYNDYKNHEIKSLNAKIDALNKLMETAAEEYRTIIDISTVDFENTEYFNAKAFVGRSRVADITVLDSLFFNFDNPGNFSIGESYHLDESEKKISLSLNDAAAMGNNLLSEAGLVSYDIKTMGLDYQYIGNEGVSQKNSPQGYVINYERIVNGMPVTSTTRFNVEQSMINDYVEFFQDERLQLAVDDAGIAQFNWESYYALDGNSASVVDILPMDEEMKDIIVQQIYNFHSYNETIPGEEKKNKKYVINSVELVMGRVPMKDNPERQWLIPVWNVYATSYTDTREGYIPSDRGPSLVLSVNAIDGSIN